MKTKNSQRILALALTLCLVLGMVILPKAEAVTDNWQTVYTQTSTKVEIEANDPFNATFITRASAYYTKKIDVQTGTKISFDVNFPAIDTTLQYGFALMDRPNATHAYASNGNGAAASGLVAELVTSGTTLTAGAATWITGTRTGLGNGSITSSVAATQNTTDVYNIAFEKLAETDANSWKVTITRPDGTSASYNYAATRISHDMFANGAYVAMSSMNGKANTLKVSNLKVTQPNTATNWKVVRSAGLNGIVGELVSEKTNAFDATFNEFVTGYYDQKIKVQEGTTVSFRAQFPKMTDGINVQYAFSLVDRAGSFYTSDKNANSLSLEVASIYNADTGATGALNAVASKKLTGAGSRTFLANAFTLATARSTTDVYDITFKKINETISGVNYSWIVTVMKNGATPYAYRYKASDIPHDFFQDGAYLAVGSMDGGATHTMQVSKLNVSSKWNVLAGTTAAAYNMVTEGAESFNVSFRNVTTGYYNQKIHVEEGTAISMKVKPVVLKASTDMQFGIYLANAPKYYNSVGSGKALGVELTSVSAFSYQLRALVCSRVPSRATHTNDILSNSRITTVAYTLTFEKLPASEANSWKVTIANGATVVREYQIADTVVPDDMFADGLYISAGSLNSATGHNMELSDLEITNPNAGAYVDGVPYTDVLEAVEAADGETVQLVQDLAITEALPVEEMSLDLNGKTLSGTENLTLGEGSNLTVKGGTVEGELTLAADGATITADCPIALEMNGKTATVNASDVALTDAATDNGELGGKLYGKATAKSVTEKNGISYVTVSGSDEGGAYITSNAVRVKVKRINVRPGTAGLYYTTEVIFNQNVADAGAEYGVALSLVDKPDSNFLNDDDTLWTKFTAEPGANFKSEGTSCLINNIFKTGEDAAVNADRGDDVIHANAYVKVGDVVVMMENVSDVVYSMKTVMEGLDGSLKAYVEGGELSENAQKALDFYETWKDVMIDWNLPNMVQALAKKNAA